MSCRGAAAGAALALVLAAAPAAAGSFLEPADAAELANVLAEATDEQGICYGWTVLVNGATVDEGSSAGPDVAVRAASGCERYVAFVADLTYTAESSESEDRAAYRIVSNVVGAPGTDDLARIGVTSRSLLGASDDVAVFRATAALPLLAAERGIVPPLPVEPNDEALPAGDEATGAPGSDWLRERAGLLWLGAGTVVAGLALALYARFSSGTDL